MTIIPCGGDIAKGEDIGKKDERGYYIWASCLRCGKERWVNFKHNKPVSLYCASCAQIISNPHKGNLHSSWKGGQTIQKGYIVIYNPEHPNHDINGYVERCRLILESELGEILPRKIDIHHINRIKTDDRLENLMVLSHAEHLRLHGLERGGLQKEKSNA